MSAPPQFSPDGRWWWDGSQWIPAPPQQSGTSAGTIVVALVVFAILVVIVLSVLDEVQRVGQAGDDFDRLYCEKYDAWGAVRREPPEPGEC